MESYDHKWEAISGPFIQPGGYSGIIHVRCPDCGRKAPLLIWCNTWNRQSVDKILKSKGIRWAQWETAKP